MFKCRLKIEGRYRKLSLKDGLNLGDVGDLFSKLAKCLESKGAKFTLIGVDDTSYTPVIETENAEDIVIYKELHNDIQKKSYHTTNVTENNLSLYYETRQGQTEKETSAGRQTSVYEKPD